jgi:hypothetical protein
MQMRKGTLLEPEADSVATLPAATARRRLAGFAAGGFLAVLRFASVAADFARRDGGVACECESEDQKKGFHGLWPFSIYPSAT